MTMFQALAAFRRVSLAALLLAGALPALADGPRLRPIAMVSGDVVRLADLIENAGPAGATIVFGAPVPGQSGTISTARVIAAAGDHGLLDVATEGLSSVAVRRTARHVRAEEIVSALRQRLVAEHGIARDQEIELNAGQMSGDVETAAAGPVVIRSLALSGGSSRFEATWSVEGSRALEAQPARVSGSLPDVARVPVLTKAVLKGDVIGENDYMLERRRRPDLAPDTITDPARLVGHAVRRPMGRGTLVRETDVQRPELVERNSTVTITYQTGGLNLTLRGRANAGGALGDTIQVQNLQSKKVLDAIVTAPGRVEVKAPDRPARTATAPAVN